MKRYLLLAGLLGVVWCSTSWAAVITVTTVAEETISNGKCSLREALTNSNNNAATFPDCAAGEIDPVMDEIHFNIPGPGVKSIKPFFPLPSIIDSLLIDGTTQPANDGTHQKATCSPRHLLIELDGVYAGANATGLHMSGDNTGPNHGDNADKDFIVRGLAINNFSDTGLVLAYPEHPAQVYCNHIGTDAAGLTAKPNGVGMKFSPSLVKVGGDFAGAMNLISGNLQEGIFVEHGDIRVIGNHIGVDVTGNHFIPNGGNGIKAGSFGGVSANNNIIAGNLKNGVAALDHIVGFYSASLWNNRIYGNKLLGIDLNEDGVTFNDEGDTDQGGNYLLNYPYIFSVQVVGNSLKIKFGLDVQSPIFDTKDYRIEFFANSEPDPSGFGEGEIFLGYADVTTDSIPSTTTHDVTIPLPSHIGADALTHLTALTVEKITGPGGGFGATSEFSPVFKVSFAADYGDAPDTSSGTSAGNYQTTSTDNGAAHLLGSDLYLGSCADADSGKLQNIQAGSDDADVGDPVTGVCATPGDDEDGFVFAHPEVLGPVEGKSNPFKVLSSGSGKLNVWADFNNDGDWNDEGEYVVSNKNVVAGWNYVNIPIPLINQSFAYFRIRLNSAGGLGPVGIADDGEVEDYRIGIVQVISGPKSGTGEGDSSVVQKWAPQVR